MAVTPLVRPVTCTGVLLLPVVEPLPSSPVESSPQHITAPPVVRAHAANVEMATEVTPVVRPVTGTGTALKVAVEPLPSAPFALSPQQTAPPDATAHANAPSPRATEVVASLAVASAPATPLR